MTSILTVIADIKISMVEKTIKLSFKVVKVVRLAIIVVAIEEVKFLAVH